MNIFDEVNQIPVFAGPENNDAIGFAEVKNDGSVAISIHPGMLERNSDLRVVEQIHAFYVHYKYTLPDPCQPLPERNLP